MTRVLELCVDLGIGGTGKLVRTCCKYFDKARFKVFACGLFQGGVREASVQEHAARLLVADGDIDMVCRFILENDVSVVHWHGIWRGKDEYGKKSFEVLRHCRAHGIRVVETSPFCTYDEAFDELVDLKLFISKISLLKYSWKYGHKLRSRNKYYFLPVPLDTAELGTYRMTEEQIGAKKQELGIGRDDFVCGRVGRIDLWKWDDTIIDLVPYLLARIPRLKIVIRAIPETKKRTIRKKGLEEHFVLLPETVVEREIAETYQLMDVLLHTSRIGECCSSSFNEAMFFGKPIVTNSTDFMKYTFFERDNGQVESVEDGVNGFVENDLKRMADRVVLLRENRNLYNSLSKGAFEKAMRVYDAKNIVRKLEDMLVSDDFEREDASMDISEYRAACREESFRDLLRVNAIGMFDRIRMELGCT